MSTNDTVAEMACGCRPHADGCGITWCSLHAAAPDLLAACEAFVAVVHEYEQDETGSLTLCDYIYDHVSAPISQAHAAIAKARRQED